MRRELAKESSHVADNIRALHRKHYHETVKHSPEQMERQRVRSMIHRHNKDITPEERERRRQYARGYAKKKREQRDNSNTDSSASSSSGDSEEIKTV